MKKKKIYIIGKFGEFILPIVTGAFLIAGIALMCIREKAVFYLGIFVMVSGILMTLAYFVIKKDTPSYAVADMEKIAFLTIFKKTVKSEKWSDLKFLDIKKLKSTSQSGIDGKYIILYFSLDADYRENVYGNLLELSHVMAIADTKENRTKLREFLPEKFKAYI